MHPIVGQSMNRNETKSSQNGNEIFRVYTALLAFNGVEQVGYPPSRLVDMVG